ncbi:hypothetical protein KI688_000639 [Linnemannia hyalina]|uniref:Uncharacterized protein n=1 Tax=Linnemannia hyalina TaxID=64524 RepID=A0A9P7Y3V3_9FUNG|nr:hypothetical protein KI688_000639 [Linnemannia hyalina]
MDIRRLLKATCPLARPLLGHPTLATIGARSKQGHANRIQIHLCSHYRSQPHHNRVHSIHHQATHTASCFSSPYRTTLRVGEQTSPPVSSQLRRTCGCRLGSGTLFASGSLKPTTIAKRCFGTSSRAYKLFSIAGSPTRTPSSTSSIPRSTTSEPNTLPTSTLSSLPPNSLVTSTLAQVAKYNDPTLVARLGRKRRHIAGMHGTRLKRQLKLMQRSQPQHSSQLLGINGLPSGFTNQGRFGMTKRKNRRRIGVKKAQRDALPAQYHHIHYFPTKEHPRHVRFLGITDFLRFSRAKSSPGRVASARRMANLRLKRSIKKRNDFMSIRRPYILEQQQRVAHMNQVLEEGPARLAIIDAILLIRGKKGGAKLPAGNQLYKVVKLDQTHYFQLRAADTTPTISSLPAGAPEPVQPRHFTTQDYNVILTRCEELKDWRTGFNIGQALLTRYRSPGFDFGVPDFGAPNVRTIHLLAKMFVRAYRSDRAVVLFSTLHKHYPHPIPLDVYTSYLGELGSMKQFVRMESTLRYLETAGPRPTVTQYNTLLKAIGLHKGQNQAEEFMAQMVKAGTTPDQQTYRILINTSLRDLDVDRAHFWLGEYARQGFEVFPRMMEPFMSTCVRQVSTFAPKKLGSYGVDNASVSREWMFKAMNIIQFMTRQELSPTARTFELLIDGFLAQDNSTEARRVLNLMRSSPYIYTPNPRTWISLFEYHLRQDEPLLALKTLNEMWRSGAGLKSGDVPLGITVPTSLYRQLFQHYLSKSKLSMAERSLYEMMDRHKDARPKEKDVVDLIWKLDRLPEAAERVYELLYAQSGDRIERDIAGVRKNRIIEDGPIVLANVGVMRAKANSKDRLVRDDVWKAWTSMVRYLDEDGSARDTPVGERFGITIDPGERSVLALAFEQVAKAARQVPQSSREVKQIQQEAERTASRLAGNDWDFTPVRHKPGMGGLGLGLRLGQSGIHGSDMSSPGQLDRHGGSSTDAHTKHLEFKGRQRKMIQQLLRHQEFLDPLLERRDMNVTLPEEPLKTLSSHPSLPVESRLEQLKDSFQWVRKHSIPIGIEGFNAYLAGLISYQDFKAARRTLDAFFAKPHSKGGSKSKVSILAPLKPDIATVEILKEYQGVLGGIKSINLAFEKGGPNLAKEWTRHQISISRKRTIAALKNNNTSSASSSPSAASSPSSSSSSSPPPSSSAPSSTPTRAVAFATL